MRSLGQLAALAGNLAASADLPAIKEMSSCRNGSTGQKKRRAHLERGASYLISSPPLLCLKPHHTALASIAAHNWRHKVPLPSLRLLQHRSTERRTNSCRSRINKRSTPPASTTQTKRGARSRNATSGRSLHSHRCSANR
ncbi:MAG: hypothetical protein RLZZ399_2303, partial [Verrucomicrobiota bacterium]